MEQVCIGCQEPPDLNATYVLYAMEAGITPAEYVRRNEGTYNRRNGHYWCDDCYIRAGMPLGVAP